MKMSMMIMLIMMMWVMFRKTKQMEVALHRIQKIFTSGWTGLRKLVLPEHLAMLIIKMMIFRKVLLHESQQKRELKQMKKPTAMMILSKLNNPNWMKKIL